jgi:hypothetical protein
MAMQPTGKLESTPDKSCPTAARIEEQLQAAKDCYCGLGTDCTHWRELTPEGRLDCSRDKRAVVDSLWKTGTIR